MSTPQISYKLSPQSVEFVAEHTNMFLLFILSLLLIGSDELRVRSIAQIISLLSATVLLYQFWFFTTVEWEVTFDKIRFTRGIFHRRTDYLELYRVIDYREEQHFTQQLLGVKTLIIYANDRSHKTLCIYGLREEDAIVEFIRSQVEEQRNTKNIYEIANH